MRKNSRYALLLCFFMQPMSAAAEPLELRTRGDIQDASMMDKVIVLLSEKVSECVQRKAAAPSECFCLYPVELSNVKKAYEVTIQKHPTWANNVISYMQGEKTHAISFSGLKLQLQKACQRQG